MDLNYSKLIQQVYIMDIKDGKPQLDGKIEKGEGLKFKLNPDIVPENSNIGSFMDCVCPSLHGSYFYYIIQTNLWKI